MAFAIVNDTETEVSAARQAGPALDDRSFSTVREAAIVTVGDELLCGEVANTNGKWLASELEKLGIAVRIMVTLPDDRATVADFIRSARRKFDLVVVTGGLGCTPDDITRDAIADAFAVGRRRNTVLARRLEAAGGYSAVFSSEWGSLPVGSRLIEGHACGAPAFAIENVFVLAGMPGEMRAAFRTLRKGLRAESARHTLRAAVLATEDQILPILKRVLRAHRDVRVGSYPIRRGDGKSLKLILRGWCYESVASAASLLDSLLRENGIESLQEWRRLDL